MPPPLEYARAFKRQRPSAHKMILAILAGAIAAFLSFLVTANILFLKFGLWPTPAQNKLEDLLIVGVPLATGGLVIWMVGFTTRKSRIPLWKLPRYWPLFRARRAQNLREGLCLRCDQNLNGLPRPGVCPNCGKPYRGRYLKPALSS